MRFSPLPPLLLWLLASSTPLAGQAAAGTYTFSADTARAVHLLSRATFGVRAEDVAEVLRLGEAAWLDRQLHPERIEDSGLGSRLARFPAAAMEVGPLMAAYPPPQLVRRQSQREMLGDSMPMRPRPDSLLGRRPGAPRDSTPPGRRAASGPQRVIFDMVGAKLVRAVHSERQLQEVMTDFWFDHFNVFLGKGPVRYLAGDYEREAIRPHVFGRFEDMLLATARHPAMLFYLDNWQSVAPGSAAADVERARRQIERMEGLTPEQRERLIRAGRLRPEQLERVAELKGRLPEIEARAAARGLNENYARELLELHTLGVDGGYAQQDVVEVARAFTGWSMTQPYGGGRQRPGGGMMASAAGEGPRYVFRADRHDEGEKTILGRRFPPGQGEEEGEAVLRMLARHPSTARHIATKLAERFVSDDPSPALVDRLAQVFLQTDGDLREVTRALFTAPELYDPANVRSKVKRPLDLVASALRVTRVDVGPSRALPGTLRTLDHLPYMESAPTGYPATSEEWTSSGSMLGRMNFALALAAGRVDGARVDGQRLLAAPTLDAGGAGEDGGFALGGGTDIVVQNERLVDALLQRVLPGVAADELRSVVLADLAERPDEDLRVRGARALGLILGSPDFQRH